MKRSAATALLLASLALAGPSACATMITQEDFQGWYDYSDFFAYADGKAFPVQIYGNPFVANPTDGQQSAFVRAALAQMQAHTPSAPRMTLVPFQRFVPNSPNYRLSLLFSPSEQGAEFRLCSAPLAPSDTVRPRQGEVVLEIALCRNDQTMSSLKARFAATSVTDPHFGTAFDQIFSTLLPQNNPIHGEDAMHRR